MKIFISGATGFIGSRLALKLAGEGHEIHALYRSEHKKRVLDHPNVRFFKGDILDYQSLKEALAGCSGVYHTAAFAGVWTQDSMQIYRHNVEGAMNVFNAAIWAGAERIVCTSTAGVIGHSPEGESVNETSPLPEKYFLDYENSKRILEESVKTLASAGVNIVMVSPTRVYGPGPLNESNSVTRIFSRYMKGNWKIIPGDGTSTGNYVFIDDVITGHIKAMEHGKPGEKYILGGTDIDYNEFFEILAELTGLRYRMIHIPLAVSKAVAGILTAMARVTGKAPLITPALVEKYNHNWKVSSNKAMRELNYNPVDFRTGAKITIDWLRGQ